ncbi:MAG: c-type cytochrome [Rhodobacteraceae bacterium]|jgi:cytochrome c553|nr:c-type cytochrome [Paracoccaceae bacterium]
MERTRLIAGGLAAAGLGAVAVAGLVVWSGVVSVSARPPHGAVTTAVLHTTFARSVAAHAANLTPPADLDAPGRVVLGAQTYAQVCSNCHGSPGLGQSPIALSMRPSPQYLPAVVDQFDDAELAWIVDNGVRFSAMPAWPAEGRLDETWSMVAFLRRLPGMTAAEYRSLTGARSDAAVPRMPVGPDIAPVDSTMPRRSAPLSEYAWTVPSAGFGQTGPTDLPMARCAACHGVDGRGTVTGGQAPNLTIQTPEYIAAALRAYAEARRHSGFMQPQAAALSPDQITALAAYLAAVPRPADGPARIDAAVLARGQEIAVNGLPQARVAACLDCHERGADVPERGLFVPSLYGQSEAFLRNQLDVFARGGRGSTGIYNPMHAEAHGLAPADRDAVAAWLSAQAPTRAAGLLPTATGTPAPAVADPVRGLCMTCHGPDLVGDAQGDVPNLTLQTAPYLVEALHDLATDPVHGRAMTEVARKLLPEDIAGIAAWIGAQTPVPTLRAPDPAAVARGAVLAENGDPARALPACLTCHGATETRALPLFARLNGQHAPYLERRLGVLATLAPATGLGLNPMQGIASRLTAAERADLAAYFASLPPVPK